MKYAPIVPDPLTRPPSAGVAERFWTKVDRRGPDECWPWMASRSPKYGQFWIEYYRLPAHRVSWWLANGPIPEGLYVLHTCDNPSCVNPAHLFLGTHANNMTDMVQKGRQARGTDHGMTKLTEDDVRAIRKEYANTLATQQALARKYGVTHTTISRMVNRYTWRHVE